ncbi:CG9722 [Drosophila busckii]|uniref:CG9722 n=2 Tax=Drosophila busckii TaxID=30019 RepID=A0A0M3QXA9_DROBS|nr:CG9722 [Drosophila busckii]
MSFDNQSVRLGFIRKVYMILLTQLLFTFAVISLFLSCNHLKRYVQLNQWLLWLAMGIMLITLIALMCCQAARRRTPTNYICLGAFTAAQSFMLAIAASHFDLNSVLMAVGLTAAICLGLTIFALQTKYDFTMLGGVLVSCMIALLLFGLAGIFIGGNLVGLMLSSFSAVLFSVYLIYDTQLMLGGQHQYAISPEEYIFAALNLYMDIANIFMDILRILADLQE